MHVCRFLKNEKPKREKKVFLSFWDSPLCMRASIQAKVCKIAVAVAVAVADSKVLSFWASPLPEPPRISLP